MGYYLCFVISLGAGAVSLLLFLVLPALTVALLGT